MPEKVVHVAAGSLASFVICRDNGTRVTTYLEDRDQDRLMNQTPGSSEERQAVKRHSRVYSWGAGDCHGQLGHQSYVNHGPQQPRLIQALAHTSIVHISAGMYFVLALSREGTVYSWGKNNWGQCGHGVNDDDHDNESGAEEEGVQEEEGETKSRPEKCQQSKSDVLMPRKIKALEPYFVLAISAGDTHALAICGTFVRNRSTFALLNGHVVV